MHWLVGFNLLLASQIVAGRLASPVRLNRRDFVLGNSTADNSTEVDSDNSVIESTLSSTDDASTSSSDNYNAVIESTLSSTDDTSTSSSDSDLSTSISPLPSFSTESPSCTGLTTYDGRPPLTVYETVTESYDVTVTASDVSITEAPILITPPPACVATSSEDSDQTTTEESDPSTILEGDKPRPQALSYHPFAISGAAGLAPHVTQGEAQGEDQSIYTATVTKKTPVPVVASPLSSAPVFQILPSEVDSTDTLPSATIFFTTKRLNVPLKKTTAVPSLTKIAVANFVVSSGDAAPTPAEPPAAPALGDIAAAPATTSIGNVAVTVFPSSIAIGDQVVAIPAKSQTTVQVDHQTFTIRPSEVIAPDTTLALTLLQHAQVITPAPVPTVVTADGLTLTVGASSAVIEGKTYKIGDGIAPTTTVVHGKTISIGPNGVGLPDTTVAVPTITGHAFAVESAEGLTFSIDASEAVISGTTYRIGAGASAFTTVIGGHTISIGSGGLGFAKTTAKPTTVSTHATKSGSRSSKSSATATESADVQNYATSQFTIPFSEAAGWMLKILFASWFANRI